MGYLSNLQTVRKLTLAGSNGAYPKEFGKRIDTLFAYLNALIDNSVKKEE